MSLEFLQGLKVRVALLKMAGSRDFIENTNSLHCYLLIYDEVFEEEWEELIHWLWDGRTIAYA